MSVHDSVPTPYVPSTLAHSAEAIADLPMEDLLDRTGEDFPSYRLLNETGDLVRSGIARHNAVAVAPSVSQWRAIRRRMVAAPYDHIVDLGCGAGFQTSAIATVFPEGQVHGIEISGSAIAYATRTFGGIQFIQGTIDPEHPEHCALQLLRQRFAPTARVLITACEFYPFTRTASAKDHERWLHWLLPDERTRVFVKLSNRYVVRDEPTILDSRQQVERAFSIRDHVVCVPSVSALVHPVANHVVAKVLAWVPPAAARLRVDRILDVTKRT